MKKIWGFGLLMCLSHLSWAQNFYLLAGTYTGEGSKGIYVYQFDSKTGKAKLLSSTDSTTNPSFLTVSANGKFIYAVNETGGDDPGYVSAFSFDKKNGKIKLINSQKTGGDHPCYITIDKTNKWLLVGNYSGGNVSALPIMKDGSIDSLAQLVQHTGSSANQERQEKAHVHAAVLSPDQKYLFTPDLGIDKVMIYPFNANAKKPLKESGAKYVKSLPGNGPRHMEFHPTKKLAYLIEELSGTVSVYKYVNNNLIFLQRISTHPKDYKGSKGSADIHISPDGKFLYATNRGDANTITIFSIANDGKLSWKGYMSTGGVHPRNFMIDPTGNWLLVANRDTDNIVVFKRNKQTGLLRKTENDITLSMPVFLKMIK